MTKRGRSAAALSGFSRPSRWLLVFVCLIVMASGASLLVHSQVPSDDSPKDTEATATNTIYGNGLRPLVEEKDTVQTLNVYGPGNRIVAPVVPENLGNEEVRYPVADHLGSTRMVLDKSGNSESRFDYTPQGEVTTGGEAAATVPPRFAGHPASPGLNSYHFPLREYDPVTGRFLEVDPKRVNPSPYIYASNNLLNRVDPTGGADRPFILIEYDSFPSFLTSDQVSATVLRFLDLPMSFANAIVDMDTLKAPNAAAAENWGSYAEMHPMEILRGGQVAT